MTTEGQTDTAGAASPPRDAALDGIRALAVAAVILYHADAISPGRHLAPGGFLGVSVFFTLSGFLVGGQLLATAPSRRSPAGSFLRRRLIRLAPASLATVAAVLAVSRTGLATWGIPAGFAPTDVMTTITQIANWHLIGLPDGANFRLVGPLVHFWSLSVEAQWYLGLTAVVATVWAATGDPIIRRRRVLAAAAVSWVASALLAVVLHGSLRREEFGADVRLAEFAAGVLLAGYSQHVAVTAGRHRRLVDAVGTAALFSLLAALALADRGSSWLASGGYAAMSVVWVALIVAALHGAAVRRALATAPVAAVGRASYSAYLVHWPVVLILTDDRVPGGRAVALAARVVVSAVAATAMYLVVERPSRTVLTRWHPLVLAAAWAAATLVLWVGAVITLGP